MGNRAKANVQMSENSLPAILSFACPTSFRNHIHIYKLMKHILLPITCNFSIHSIMGLVVLRDVACPL